jgi:hypothetical protein
MRTVATHAVWQRGWKTTVQLNGGIDKKRRAEKPTVKASGDDGRKKIKKVKIPWMMGVQHRNRPMITCPRNCPAQRSNAIFVVHMALW